MSGAKEVALLVIQHSDKIGAVVGAAFNGIGLVVGLCKEKNKNDCILAFHAGKEILRIELELRKFPDLYTKFERQCAILYDEIPPHPMELNPEGIEEAREVAKSITDHLLDLKKYGNELCAHLSSCSLVQTSEMMECLRHFTCACSTFEDSLKSLKKNLQRGCTPSGDEIEEFDRKCRTIALKQEGINDAFKICNNCISNERKN